MSHPGLHVDIADGVAVVTIDRPKANAIDAATSYAMGEVFVSFEHDPNVRVAILTGEGERFFSAGWALGAAGEGEAFDSDYGAGGFGGFTNLPNRRTPVIAAVNGMAVGGGFEIAMAADAACKLRHAGSNRLEHNDGFVFRPDRWQQRDEGIRLRTSADVIATHRRAGRRRWGPRSRRHACSG